ncbi:pyridoxal phosphate-dependent aminotransferase [Liquorilactobacillus mali]|nr:pyridoxal phosphate-dependent aminotransferase [Liquorilactobacillus mali]EJF01605.1 aspartate transaminase [Liquorilactobacillus mali KCTC 3596 = DSM 20444]QFQ74431.1 pyridoxal phosphate-dependent aminotransferase [Liquorilactobacillus mali]
MDKKSESFANWTRKVGPSETADMEERVDYLKRKGENIYSFALGMPNFFTPEYIKNGAKAAIDSNKSFYTATSGIMELKREITHSLYEKNNVDYKTSEIVVTNGGKQAVFDALYSMCNQGEEVMIPSPYWVSYISQTKLMGFKPIVITTSEKNGFKVSVEDLKKAVTDKSKVLILNSPNNPTGAIYGYDELADIAKFCIENDLYVISDEVYSEYIYNNKKFISISSFEKMKDRTVVVNAFSKTYGMTGWRIGYSASSKQLASFMTILQSHSTSNVSSISQYAAVTAFDDSVDKSFKLSHLRSDFKKRRALADNILSEIKGFKYILPEGAFYFWIDISEYINKNLSGTVMKNATDFANIVLQNTNVALMPGDSFGDSSHIRLSFSISEEKIRNGLLILKNYLNKEMV